MTPTPAWYEADADDSDRNVTDDTTAPAHRQTPNRPAPTECPCMRCLSDAGVRVWWMVVCDACGNKRCPHAGWHGWECTGSNEPGQVGATDDITASTPQEPRGAILPASEPARGFSDADLLTKRTAALNRTSAENERLRAEVGRLRAGADSTPRMENAWPTSGQLWHTLLGLGAEERLEQLDRLIEEASNSRFLSHRQATDTQVQQADLAEILRTLRLGTHARPLSPHEVVHREVLPAIRRLAPASVCECGGPAMRYDTATGRGLADGLARSQAPQAPAEQEGFCPVCGGDERQGCRDGFGGPADHGFAPSVPPATADDEPPADAHTPEERILRDILTNQPE